MPGLREEIRAILREELAALRAETAPSVPSVERVRIASSAELNRFARDLIARAAAPGFAARVARGDLVFDLAEPAVIGGAIVSGPSRPAPAALDKTLITERDIASLGTNARVLRISRISRLTPLARDEARRLGIRIERIET